MASLSIEGIPNPVTVDDSFRDLAPEAQAATVEEIRAAYTARQAPAQAAPNTSSEPTGLGLGAVREGARGVVQGLSATARVGGDAVERLVGPGMVSRGLQAAGESLNDAIPVDPNYVPSGPAVAQGIRDGNYGAVVRNLPGAIAETVPGLVGTLGAGAIGSAVGGPVGGLAAAGTFGAAQQFGTVAEARARNDGETVPGTGNLIAAGATALGTGALDAIGARGLGGPIAAAANRGLVAQVGQGVRVTGREALTEAGQTGVEHVGSTFGTRDGLRVDPAEMAAAGLVGGATRGTMAAPGAVVRGTVESIATAGANATVGDVSVREAASIERVNRLMETTRESVVSGRDVPNDELLNTARTELTADVLVQLRQAREQGWIDDKEYTAVSAVFQTAATHNKELTDGAVGSTARGLKPDDDPNFRSGLARLDQLKNAPPAFRNAMNDLFRDVNTLSAASRKKNVTGPFEKFGRVAGGATAIGIGAATGGPMGAAAGIAASIGSNPLAARVGGAIGRAVDGMAGTRNPVVVLARQKAQRILSRSGSGDPGDARVMLTEIDRLLTDERLASRAANGLPTDPETMARLVAEQIGKKQIAATEAAVRKGDAAKQRAMDDVEAAKQRDLTADSVAGIKAQNRAKAKAAADEAAGIAREVTASEAASKAGSRARVKVEDRIALATTRDEAAEIARNVKAEQSVVKKAEQRSRATTEQDAATLDAAIAATGRPAVEPVQAPAAPPATPVAPEAPQPAPAPPQPPSRANSPETQSVIDKAVRKAGGTTDKTGTSESETRPMFGWERYIQTSFQSKGRAVSRQEMRDAIEQLDEQGAFLSDELPAMRSNPTFKLPPERLGFILDIISQKQGFSWASEPDRVVTTNGLIGPGDNPAIRSPTRYASATESYRLSVARASDAAYAANDFELVELVETLGNSTLKDMPEAIREFRVKALIEGTQDVGDKARRKAALMPLLKKRDGTPAGETTDPEE